MSDDTVTNRRRGLATGAAAVAAAVIVLGGLVAFVPYLLVKRPTLASVASRPRENLLLERGLSGFTIGAHQRACMSAVTVTPQSAVAEYALRSEAGVEHGAPPLELVLSAQGYRAAARLPGGEYGQHLEFPIRPPRKSVIGNVCLLNRGKTPVTLQGTADPATFSRSILTIADSRVAGNLTLTFYEKRPRPRLADIGEAFHRISNLTDHLIPVWLVWLIAVVVALAVPIETVFAVRRALLQDEATA